MAGKGLSIEERSGQPVLLQALAKRLEALRIVRQLDRQLLKLLLRRSDEFGQADARSRLAATLPAKVSPMRVNTGNPAQSASLAVV